MSVKRFLALLFLLGAGSGWTAERAIEWEVVVPARVEAVWQSWTTTERIKTFFAPEADVQLRPDGPFEVHFNPFAAAGQKGADGMRILAYQTNRMLAFTWNAPPHLPEARQQRTVVILRFEPSGDNQTRVQLHHVGWGDGGEWDKTYEYFSRAWPAVLANLQKRFTSGPLDWTEWLQRMKAATK